MIKKIVYVLPPRSTGIYFKCTLQKHLDLISNDINSCIPYDEMIDENVTDNDIITMMIRFYLCGNVDLFDAYMEELIRNHVDKQPSEDRIVDHFNYNKQEIHTCFKKTYERPIDIVLVYTDCRGNSPGINT